jgi:hypothetical protein
MIIIEKKNYKILRDEKEDAKEFAAYLEKNHSQFANENVVIDILNHGELSLEELLTFLKVSNDHRKNKRSFVIANDAINIDRVPEELILVPTLPEAEDLIKMEEIERELGF